MDEFFDHLLSSASWPDVNANENESSYWGCCGSGQLDDPLPESVILDENGKDGNPPITLINSNQCLESLTSGESDDGLMQALLPTRSQKNGQDCDRNTPSDGGLVNLGHSQKQLQEVADMSRSLLPFVESGHVGCNGDGIEPSEFHGSDRRNMQMLSSMSGFDLQAKHVNNGSGFLSNGYDALLVGALQYDDLSASVARKELHNDFFSNFPVGPQLSTTSAGLNYPPQAMPTTISGSGNGTAKPRPRARRGQATDPHSIAERLRREKIAERMRNLQELVPNSNKTDKASMLDEILDYVKFLQLQVKVLSTSRVGAAGAPLITESQAKGSIGQMDDYPEAPDQVAFEREVVKLMESSVTMAMQYLQSKGLCLMPVALAAAISDGKTSSSSSSIVSESLVQTNISSSSNSITAKTGSEETTAKGCSRRGVKQEVNGNLKPKT